MQDKETIEILLTYEEWQKFECKRAAVQPAKLLETVVAFANTEGGHIVLGLEDPSKAKNKKRLIGISENPDNVSEFLKLIDKEIDSQLKSWTSFEVGITNTNNCEDKLVIIDVKKSNDVHSLRKGDTFVRKGRQNVKIGSTEIIRLKYEKGSIKFEEEISGITTLEDIDQGLLGQYKKDTQSEGEDDWQFLKDNGLAIKKEDGFRLTKAGVLLFANNPAILLKNKCGIKVSHYHGTRPSFSDEPNFLTRPFTIEGPLINQISEAVDYFKNVVKNSPPKLHGSSFKPSLLIPEWAFQEAITNAVIHRNYSIQDDIQVRFFGDRVEVESPGTYPGHITINNIRSERYVRNPIVLRTLNRFQSAPNLDIGEGVDRMFEVMRNQNLYDPLFFPPAYRPNSVLLFLLNQQKIEYWDIVSNYLSEHYRIANSEARKITGIGDTLQMSRLLKMWQEKGLLEKIDSGFKGNVFYRKPGVEIPAPIFKSSENGGT